MSKSSAYRGAAIRRGPMAADAFTQIRNVLFRDKRLSFKAKGVFGLISTHQDGFGVSADSIAGYATDGRSAVQTALRELERFGYLVREQPRQQDGTLGRYTYYITDMPRSEPEAENLSPALTCDDEPPEPDRARGDAKTGPVTCGNPETPRSRPETDFPSTDNQPLKKTMKKNTREAAPPARSAADRRRPSAGGDARGREGGGGANDGAKAPDARPASDSGGFTVDEAVQSVLVAFPERFREAMRDSAQTDRPRTLVRAVQQALEDTDRQRVAERVRRRWSLHGYARLFEEGSLRSPVGAAVAMVKAGPCPDPRCEDGWLEDGSYCRACAEREADERADRERQEAPETPERRPVCPQCGTGLEADGEPCGTCARAREAARAETAQVVERAERTWTRVLGGTGTAGLRARARVEEAVGRARTEAAEAGATPAGQELAARLAALEETQQARQAIAERDQAGLSAYLGRRGRRDRARTPADAPIGDGCPGPDGEGCPDGRPAVGSSGLCVRCRTSAAGTEGAQES